MHHSLDSTATATAASSSGHTLQRRLTMCAALTALAAVFLTLALGASSASAHQWGSWHWNRGGSAVPIYVYNYATTSATAERARADIHFRAHPIYLNNTNQHTDVSVFDDNVAGASYCGLAEIINWSGSHITHAHARYNQACGGNSGTGPNYAQGVYCQEIGHTLGLDHSDTGDCMGLGYFSGSSGRYCFGISCSGGTSHPTTDLTNMYRYHAVTSFAAMGSGDRTASGTGQAPVLKEKAAVSPPSSAAGSDIAAKRDCAADAPANVTAAWRFKPNSIADVRAKAPTIVLADVLSVEQAPDDVMEAPGEPGGEIRTPRQTVRLKVRKAYKGAAEGAILTLSKLGGDCYRIDDDPAYVKGETDLLMLERGPRGALQVVSPEGRYAQAKDGTLKAVGHSDIAAQAASMRADEIAG